MEKSTHYITAKYFHISQCKEEYIIGTGTKQIITSDKKRLKDIVNIAHFFLVKRDEETARGYLNRENIHEESWQFMRDKRFIINNDSTLEDRYSRNHIYYENLDLNSIALQKTIAEKHILIAGCGGIGNAMAYSLASAGIGKLTLLDNDRIEASNLNRQFLFTDNDIGKLKVDVLKKALEERHPKITINAIANKSSTTQFENIHEQTDLIVLSADDNSCIHETNHHCVTNKIPYLNVGYLSDISVIGPFYIPDTTACMLCEQSIFSEEPSFQHNTQLSNKIKHINSNMTAPSSIINNFFAASMAMVDLLFYFSGDYHRINSFNKRIGLSNRDFSRLEVPVRRNSSCALCS